jgi:hypothetical protein
MGRSIGLRRVPWKKMDGTGGDGSTHSFRRKSSMLRILSTYPPPPDNNDADYYYFLKHMLSSSKLSSSSSSAEYYYPYKVANPETTRRFGGITTTLDPEQKYALEDEEGTAMKIVGAPPFVISGTLPGLEWSARESLLQVCPEWKMIFPSMHEPSCFGAHPNGPRCKATICALRENVPGHGC